MKTYTIEEMRKELAERSDFSMKEIENMPFYEVIRNWNEL